jgi:L-threonine-O-3-phosphate decarboxylase
MVKGWTSSSDGRHHGAHYAEAAQALGTSPDTFLDFSQNINPLGPPRVTLAAAEKALHEEAGRYPDLDYAELRAALAGYLGVLPAAVLPTNGGAEALFLAARVAARGMRSKAIILEPTFSEYAAAARAAGFEVERVIVRRPEKGFRLDLAVLDGALGGRRDVGLVFLCNPNNPTGDAVSRRDVLWVAERVWETGAVLVVDEAFADFTPHLSVAPEVDENLFVARSFTKFFAVPGLRLGCLITSDVERARAFQPSWPVNAVAAAVGISAARDRAFAEATLTAVELRRQELLGALEELPGITAYPGAANFLLVRGPQTLPEDLARRGVLVRGCEPFRGLGPGFFRVAVRGAEENGRLVEVLRSLLGEAP